MNVQSPPPPPGPMTIEAFGRWAETQERKYELVDGVPKLQTWVKRNHNRITVNIVMALGRVTDPDAFEIATGNFAVKTGPRTIRYADVMVEAAGGPGETRTTEEPFLLVEVLSRSTMHVDFGAKLREYQALSPLDTYLVVAQDQRRVWQWTRTEGREWPAEPLQIDDETGKLAIPAIGAVLTFADIYRNVQFKV